MTVEGYRVKRVVHGTATMGDGRIEPATTAYIYQGERLITTAYINASTFCCSEPLGHGQGLKATDEQIIVAVLGDEHIFSGAPSFPEHHDEVVPR